MSACSAAIESERDVQGADLARIFPLSAPSIFNIKRICIGYKNIPVSIDDAPKAVQGERNIVTTISARSAQRI